MGHITVCYSLDIIPTTLENTGSTGSWQFLWQMVVSMRQERKVQQVLRQQKGA